MRAVPTLFSCQVDGPALDRRHGPGAVVGVITLGAGDRGPESEPSTAAHAEEGLLSPYTAMGPPADQHDATTDQDRAETAAREHADRAIGAADVSA